MKDKLILKALVCSAFMCSLSVGTMAADVSTDVKGGDTEQSSWMDRTDIGIGLQGTMSMPTSAPMYSMTMHLRINFLVLVQD